VEHLPPDYADRIRKLRGRLGLTQTQLAETLGVSFATVNRWENEQSRPSQLAWNRIAEMSGDGEEAKAPAPESRPLLDFTADPGAVLAIAEAERLTFGHMANPAFATEISQIDPLPHQRIAVFFSQTTPAPARRS
jgi:DNA-binding XRE family transcriptional regulator